MVETEEDGPVQMTALEYAVREVAAAHACDFLAEIAAARADFNRRNQAGMTLLELIDVQKPQLPQEIDSQNSNVESLGPAYWIDKMKVYGLQMLVKAVAAGSARHERLTSSRN